MKQYDKCVILILDSSFHDKLAMTASIFCTPGSRVRKAGGSPLLRIPLKDESTKISYRGDNFRHRRSSRQTAPEEKKPHHHATKSTSPSHLFILPQLHNIMHLPLHPMSLQFFRRIDQSSPESYGNIQNPRRESVVPLQIRDAPWFGRN